MKLFIAHGESRKFEFTAYGDTEVMAEVNIHKAFILHAIPTKMGQRYA